MNQSNLELPNLGPGVLPAPGERCPLPGRNQGRITTHWIRRGVVLPWVSLGALLFVLLLSSDWGTLVCAQGAETGQYAEEQLKDKAFVDSELGRVRKLRDEKQKKLDAASPLLKAKIATELRKIKVACEMLEYVYAHGYDPKNPEMLRLEYFKTAKELEILKAPETAPEEEAFRHETETYDWYHGGKLKDPLLISGRSPTDFTKFIVKEKITIFFFMSDQCRACDDWEAALEILHKNYDYYAVVRVLLADRNGQPDFRSPAARQLGIESIPYFLIYSKSGLLASRGDEALEKVREILNGYGIPQVFGKAL